MTFAEVAAMKFYPVQWIIQDILPAGVSMFCAKQKQARVEWAAYEHAHS